MGIHDKLFNDMPLEERKRLAPYMIETQILHLRQARAELVHGHQATLARLDSWIKNCEQSLLKEVGSR